MITGELKNKIDSLWDIFAAGGLVNPLDVIEQITYLMFIHDLACRLWLMWFTPRQMPRGRLSPAAR